MYGYSGGKIVVETESFGKFEPVIAALQEVNPAVTNNGILTEEFKLLTNLAKIHETKIRVFEENGLDVNSAEYKLMMLSVLELRARRHMLDPMYRALDKYSSDVPVRYLDTDDEQPNQYAVKAIRDILLGKRNGRIDKDNSHWIEEVQGTEFYYGLWMQISQSYENLLLKTYGEKAEEANGIIKALAFMKTSERGNKKYTEIFSPILSALKDGDINLAQEAILDLGIDNPNLFFGFIWESFGLNESMVIEEHERQNRMRINNINYKREETVTNARQRYLENIRAKSQADREEGLFHVLAPYIGREGKTQDGRQFIIVRKRTYFDRYTGETKDGYLEVQYKSEFVDPETQKIVKETRRATQTYGTAIRNIMSGFFNYQLE